MDLSQGGQEKPPVEAGEKAPEIPTPSVVSEVPPETPKEEASKAEMPEIVVETPSKEAIEEKIPELAKEELSGELEIGDIETDVNTPEQADRLLKMINSSQES